jgi:hypothetical protein
MLVCAPSSPPPNPPFLINFNLPPSSLHSALLPIVALPQAINMLVPDTKGGVAKYKRADIRYDIQGGLIEQVVS